MKFFIFLLLNISLLFASSPDEIQKHLSSENRASTYLENLVFDGDFENAEKFAKIANEKYKNSADILCWSGKLYGEKQDLDLAKTYYLRALAINPTHELAKIQLELIDEQESAQENKDIVDLLEFIEDKGLDFLMIFLAFLGGEIIAKRYNMCRNSSIYIMADHFIQRKSLSSCGYTRARQILSQYGWKKIATFCFIINLLVILTITIAIMIFWLFMVFHYEWNFLVYGDFLTINAEGIELYLGVVLLLSFIFTVLMRAGMRYYSLPQNEILYKIEFVEELDALLKAGSYTDIYEVLVYLDDNNISKNDMEILLEQYSRDSEAIMKFYKNDNSFNF